MEIPGVPRVRLTRAAVQPTIGIECHDCAAAIARDSSRPFSNRSRGFSGKGLDWEEGGAVALRNPNAGGSLSMLVHGGMIAAVDSYSPALRALGGTWDRARLDRFLTNPKALVPGTKMKMGGLPEAAERGEVLDFLERLAPEKPAGDK
jgi:hypothetical protein